MAPPTEACSKCNSPFKSASEYIPCGICGRPIHSYCISGITENDAKKLKTSSCPFFYNCSKCLEQIKNNKSDFNFLNIEKREQDRQREYDLKLRNMLMAAEQKDKIIAENKKMIQDLERQFTLFRQNSKRPRNEGSDDYLIQNELFESIKIFNSKLTKQEDKIVNLETKTETMCKNIEEILKKLDKQTDRSVSRSSYFSAINENNIIKETPIDVERNRIINKVTFAEALASATVPRTAIRTLTITAEDDKKASTIELLMADEICKKAGIISIKNREKFKFIIKCNDETEASKLEQMLTKKYQHLIKFDSIPEYIPKTKIVRLNTSLPQDQIKEQICLQNKWIKDTDFNILQRYEITLDDLSYINIIISSNIDFQNKLLNKGFILFNFKECRCFDHVSTMQCFNCFQYGHIRTECRFKLACKHCGKEHNFTDCPNKINEAACVNCMKSNATNGTNFNSAHIATFDRCPARINRIKALKNNLLPKN